MKITVDGQSPRHRALRIDRHNVITGRRKRRRTGDRRTQRLDLHHHLGTAMLDRLKAADDAAELLALGHKAHGQIQALLRATERFGGQVQAHQRSGLAIAVDGARRIVDALRADLAQLDASQPTRAVPGLQRRDRDAGRLRVDTEQPDFLRRRRDHQQRVGAGRIRHACDLAIEPPPRAIGAGADVVGRARPVDFGRQWRSQAQAAVGDLRQQAFARGFAADFGQQGRRQHCAGEVRRAQQMAAAAFHQQRLLDRAEAEPTVAFRNRQRAPAEFAGNLRPQRLVETFQGLDRTTHGGAVAGRSQEALGRVANHLLVVGQAQVHGRARAARRE
jgi:hypothetical protein